MANKQVSNILYIDNAASDAVIDRNPVRIKGIVLSNASTPAAIELQVANNSSPSPFVLMKLKLSSGELTKHFDFSQSPIILPDGLIVQAGGLTSGASATIIYEG